MEIELFEKAHLNHSLFLDLYLLLLHLRSQDHHLGRGVLDLQLPDDGGGVVGDEELLQVVDHHLVHAVRAVSGGDRLGELLASAWKRDKFTYLLPGMSGITPAKYRLTSHALLMTATASCAL